MSYKADNLTSLSNIDHCFFSRKNGVSIGVCEGLNIGFLSDDKEAVLENRKIVADYFNADLSLLIQKHTSDIVYIDAAEQDKTVADGFVTNKKNIILGIKTADCVPILFADEKNQIIGACHAGWRGAFSGVIKNTISKMIEIGADRKNIVAAIGPSICQASYEVNEDFYNEFISQSENNKKYFTSSIKTYHFMFNLPQYCHDLLNAEGINNISISNIDTYQNRDYYSYRRSTHENEIGCGRLVSAIVIK